MDFNPFDSPALAFLLEQAWWAKKTNSIVAKALGMGVPDPDFDAFSDADLRSIEVALMQARNKSVLSWRGFDVRHIIRQQGEEYRQFDVFCVLDVASAYLNQAAFDFLTMRDKADMRLDCNLNGERFSETNALSAFWFADEAEVKLSLAFRTSMVNEAAAKRADIASGAYVMLREPLARLDGLMVYDELRLLITPHGIGVCVASRDVYIPFWWSPDLDTNTSQVWLPAECVFAFDVLLACIWRDACIAQEKTFHAEHGFRRGYKSSEKYPQTADVVRLPRTIYTTKWGSAEDRETIETIARRAHVVRGHYRFIRDGYDAPEAQSEAALDYGIAAPPQGFTFVVPHQRGAGEAMPAARRVICRGLQVAKTILG